MADRALNGPYEGDLRRSLMDAALAVVADHDPAELSLRSVARDVGVSHAAPKNHFGDKTGLLTAIAIEGFERLGAALTDARASAPSATEGLVAAGRAYVGFSIDHPGHFRVMWRSELLDRTDERLPTAGMAAFEVLVDAVGAAQIEGWAPGRDAIDVATMAWATVHGLAQLWLDGPLGRTVEGDVGDLNARVTALLVNVFRA